MKKRERFLIKSIAAKKFSYYEQYCDRHTIYTHLIIVEHSNKTNILMSVHTCHQCHVNTYVGYPHWL